MSTENKLGHDPAFPTPDQNTALAMFNVGINPDGMSKRFYAACMAMQGLLTNVNIVDSLTADRRIWVVQRAFMVADEILEQEQL